MMIDPLSHLRLHSEEQSRRDRHLAHLAAIRAAQDARQRAIQQPTT